MDDRFYEIGIFLLIYFVVAITSLFLYLLLLPKGTTINDWLTPSDDKIDNEFYFPWYVWFFPALNIFGLGCLIYEFVSRFFEKIANSKAVTNLESLINTQYNKIKNIRIK